MIKEKNPLQELFEPAVCGTTHKTVEKIQTNQELTLIWATVDHISVRLIRGGCGGYVSPRVFYWTASRVLPCRNLGTGVPDTSASSIRKGDSGKAEVA